MEKRKFVSKKKGKKKVSIFLSRSPSLFTSWSLSSLFPRSFSLSQPSSLSLFLSPLFHFISIYLIVSLATFPTAMHQPTRFLATWNTPSWSVAPWLIGDGALHHVWSHNWLSFHQWFGRCLASSWHMVGMANFQNHVSKAHPIDNSNSLEKMPELVTLNG